MSKTFRCGFVSILGRPNAGKSTLLNALLGTKLAIVASKPQTTRTTIEGVLTLPDAQIAFLDTPGIHKAQTRLNKRMMDAVRTAAIDRDVLVYLVDSTRQFQEEDAQAVDLVKKAGAPAILALNKIDRLSRKPALLALIERYQALHPFEEYIPISAKTGDGLEILRRSIIARLPERPAVFPADHLTDQPMRFLAAEIVREKALHDTFQEVPHALAVTVEAWEESPRVIKISAEMWVEREGHKAILIGARGAQLKKIGTAARQELEAMLGRKVFLELKVRVRPRWREDETFFSAVDWRA